MMKKYIDRLIVLTVLIAAVSCSDKKNTEAIQYLEVTEQMYKNGNYDEALERIDSMQKLFPKAFDEIKAGLALKQQVRKALNEKQVASCDSLLAVYDSRIDSIKQLFVYQKDQEDVRGTFIPKSVSGNTMTSTMLRAGVIENGPMYIESVYLGGQQHNKVGVVSKDKQTAETLPINDDGFNYRFSNLGQQYEVIRVTSNHDNGISEFIFKNADSPLTVQLKGKNTISYSLSNAQKKAITDSYLLSSWITDRDSLLMAKDKALALIKYLDSKEGASASQATEPQEE